ncbi:hypothetical protein CyaNS01_01101 [Cyanobium sp. NS01]|nr:hypothetical protein CyaNS01_01101 [Cyanobium sp. NS01]
MPLGIPGGAAAQELKDLALPVKADCAALKLRRGVVGRRTG